MKHLLRLGLGIANIVLGLIFIAVIVTIGYFLKWWSLVPFFLIAAYVVGYENLKED